MYYNTNDLQGKELVEANFKAESQTRQIFEIFNLNPQRLMSPFDIQVYFPQWPITSIRRAITDLTSLGVLEKTEEKKKGMYGTDNYCWKLSEPIIENQLNLF